MSKRPDVYMELAVCTSERVPRFLAGRFLMDYLADELCRSAVERQLENAGDALAQILKQDLALFSRIAEGPLIVAFRNLLAHGYATMEYRRAYDAATTQVAELAIRVKLLRNIPMNGPENAMVGAFRTARSTDILSVEFE